MSKKELPKRVAIKYTVDFHEVPERVQLMMQELGGNFNSFANMSSNISKNMKESLVDSITNIAQLTALLDKAKIRLEDCSEILLGYAEILSDYIEASREEEAPVKKPAAKKKATKKKKKEEG